MKSITRDKVPIPTAQIEAFDKALKAKDFADNYNFGFVMPGTTLVTVFKVLNEQEDIAQLFPLTCVNIINATRPDRPYDVAKFTVDYDRKKGLEVKELQMWRQSEHEGYIMTLMRKLIQNNEEIPSRARIVQMLDSGLKAHKRKQTKKGIK